MHCKANDEAAMYRYVRFPNGKDKGRYAKIVGMNFGKLNNAKRDVIVDVVIYLDGYNTWDLLSSVATQTVEIIDGETLSLLIVKGQVNENCSFIQPI